MEPRRSGPTPTARCSTTRRAARTAPAPPPSATSARPVGATTADGGRLDFRCGCRRRAGDRRSRRSRPGMGLPTPRARAAAAPRSPEASTQTARHTSWWIEYGTTNSYGKPDAGDRHRLRHRACRGDRLPVGSRPRLPPYHYRLVAQNSLGTTYGYDYTLHDGIRARQRIRLHAFTAPSGDGSELGDHIRCPYLI